MHMTLNFDLCFIWEIKVLSKKRIVSLFLFCQLCPSLFCIPIWCVELCGEQWSIRDWAESYCSFFCCFLLVVCLFSLFFLTDLYDFWVRHAVLAVVVIRLLWISFFMFFFILQFDARLCFCPVIIIFFSFLIKRMLICPKWKKII